ncbi:hypothetical protein BDF20DRAFT_165201 [Mycotypha africana]|uniref:uncharacterized protein n=1 Tax=Mycotypha africana TaxID=64632 RepID=UPI00230121CF|nr:uncharacterized protein BDF20DRAFT_165201 [Mycotypha africana]KAI8968175.1 hypothetical protein BDF20DRAFT_165201 [Mycotypha africana]
MLSYSRQDIDPSEQITITLHVSMFSSNNAQKRSGSWYHKIKPGSITASSSSLERYIHDKDGSLCQTLLLPQRFMETEGQDQLATLMLVNNWYRQQSNSNGVAPNINGGASNPAALLKKKSSTFLLHRKHSVEFNHDDAENKSTTTTNSIEKAVGKLYIQCLYINTYGNYIPSGMDEALEALNAKRFHETKWQEGYLSQLGGNTKVNVFTSKYTY